MSPNSTSIIRSRFTSKKGSTIVGTATAGPDGNLNIQSEPLKGSLTVPLDTIGSVNPLVQPPVIYTGSITGAYSQTTGNSHLKNASLLGDFVARSEQLRLSINGRYVYGDNANTLSARNARGTIKLDFFVTKRFYWFASAYFENDRFQDLKMRTALASGPGYQFIDRGDFSGIFKDMTFYTETGVAFFNEDFRVANDQSSPACPCFDEMELAALRRSHHVLPFQRILSLDGKRLELLPHHGQRGPIQNLGRIRQRVSSDDTVQ
jgi:hypothetical protein